MSSNAGKRENAKGLEPVDPASWRDERTMVTTGAVVAALRAAAAREGEPAAPVGAKHTAHGTRRRRRDSDERAEAEPTAVDPELAERIAHDYAGASEETHRDWPAFAGDEPTQAPWHLELVPAHPASRRSATHGAHPLPLTNELGACQLGRISTIEAEATASPDQSMWILSDGAGFRSTDGAWVDLTRRKQLRRILAALVVGTKLTSEDVLRVGWPGEFVSRQAGAARVHVAISSLRRLGLGATLAHCAAGYYLDRRRFGVIHVEAPTYTGTALGY
jgi:hypothetical protein